MNFLNKNSVYNNIGEQFMDFISNIYSFLKLPFRFIVLLFIVMGALLFLPKKIITILKLHDFIEEYGKYIGIVFVVSLGYIIMSFFPFLYKVIYIKIKFKKIKSKITEKLKTLTYIEQYFLREFFIQGKDVIEAPMECTELTSLYNKNIIEFASKNIRSFISGNYASILINPLVKNKITYKHVGLSHGELTPQQIQKIKSERPDFLFALEKINNLMNR